MELFTSVPKSWVEAVLPYQIRALFFNTGAQHPRHLIPWYFVSEPVRTVSVPVALEILILTIVKKYMVQLVCYYVILLTPFKWWFDCIPKSITMETYTFSRWSVYIYMYIYTSLRHVKIISLNIASKAGAASTRTYCLVSQLFDKIPL